MEGVRQVAPVSNAEGGGRLMLSKGIDAECGVLKLCVCVCVSSRFVPSGLASVPPRFWEGTVERQSLFLHTNDLFKNLNPLSLSPSLSLSFGNCTSTQRQWGQVVSSLRLKDPLLENISRVGNRYSLRFIFFFFFCQFVSFERFVVCCFLFFFFRVGRMMMRGMENPVLFSNLHTRYELGTKEKY